MTDNFVTVWSLTPPAPIPASEYDLIGVDQIADFVGVPVARMERLLEAGFPARTFNGEWAARSRHLEACFGPFHHHAVAAE